MSRTRKYSEQRFSKTLRVPYYVDNRFSENYPDTTYEFAKVKKKVKEEKKIKFLNKKN